MASRMDFMRCPAPSVCSRMKSRGAVWLDTTQMGRAQEPLSSAVVVVVVVLGAMVVATVATWTSTCLWSKSSVARSTCSFMVPRQVRRVPKKSLTAGVACKEVWQAAAHRRERLALSHSTSFARHRKAEARTKPGAELQGPKHWKHGWPRALHLRGL